MNEKKKKPRQYRIRRGIELGDAILNIFRIILVTQTRFYHLYLIGWLNTQDTPRLLEPMSIRGVVCMHACVNGLCTELCIVKPDGMLFVPVHCLKR